MNDNERALIAGLKALAASETGVPPPHLETRLLKQLAPPRKIWPMFAMEAIAACLITGIALYPRPTAPKSDGEFVAVPYSDPIGPNERAELVRVNMPVAALAQWGFPVTAFDPSQRIDAELVLGEDGLVRSVRLLTTN